MNSRIYVLFMRTRTISSPVIRFLTWSSWSHVALVDAHGTAYEARFQYGCTARPVRYPLLEATRYQFGHCVVDSGIKQFLAEQIGKRYDWTAVLGLGVHRDWQDDDSWFCSELVATAFARVKAPLVNKRFGRVTPQDCYESPRLHLYAGNTVPPALREGW